MMAISCSPSVQLWIPRPGSSARTSPSCLRLPRTKRRRVSDLGTPRTCGRYRISGRTRPSSERASQRSFRPPAPCPHRQSSRCPYHALEMQLRDRARKSSSTSRFLPSSSTTCLSAMPIVRHPPRANSPLSHRLTPTRDGHRVPRPISSGYPDVASLFEKCGPQSCSERALVAGYWFQIGQSQKDFEARALTLVVAELGHPTKNITRDLRALLSATPN